MVRNSVQTLIALGLAGIALGGAGSAAARPSNDPGHPNGLVQVRQDHRDGRQPDRAGFPVPRKEWRRGGHVPREYLGRNYVVNDWRAYRLQAPPRGHQWISVGGDFVLVAASTGIIVQIVAGGS